MDGVNADREFTAAVRSEFASLKEWGGWVNATALRAVRTTLPC